MTKFVVALAPILALGMALSLGGCTRKTAELGSEENPIKFFFVPAVDAKLIGERAEIVKKFLEANTPYKFKMSIPASYIAVVEAFGTDRADVASLNTFGYILANEKYGAEARLRILRWGKDSYSSIIIARADSKIKDIKDINGKKFAFVDPASSSGYLLPSKLFLDNNVKPSEVVFAQKHDNVVTMVYQKQVDAGAVYYSPPEEGKIQDARRLVLTQFPDVEKAIKIVTHTTEIPNDPFVLRKTLPEEMKSKIVEAMVKFMNDPEGKKAFQDIYGSNGIKVSSDRDYDGVREMLKQLGKSASDLMKK